MRAFRSRTRLSLWWGLRTAGSIAKWYRRRSRAAEAQLICDEPAEARQGAYFGSEPWGEPRWAAGGRQWSKTTDSEHSSSASAISRRATARAVDTDLRRNGQRGGIGAPVCDRGLARMGSTSERERARYRRDCTLGRPAEDAVTLYEETEDKGFSVGVDRRQDRSRKSSAPVIIRLRKCASCRPTIQPRRRPWCRAASRTASIRSMPRTVNFGC